MTSLEGQLVNSRVPKIAIYLHTYLHASFHHSRVNSLHLRSIAGPPWTNSSHSSRLTARLVDHFQTVEDLKCTVKWCIQNLLETKRGVRVNPSNSPAYGPVQACLFSILTLTFSNRTCFALQDMITDAYALIQVTGQEWFTVVMDHQFSKEGISVGIPHLI